MDTIFCIRFGADGDANDIGGAAMAELINKWDVVGKLIHLENEYQFFKGSADAWDAETWYRKICELEIAIGKTAATDNNVGSKWIPVSERLPEEFISVLVHIPEMNPCPPVMEAYRIGDGWVTKMAAFDINCATHWMPLPEPSAEDE
jgi:hypothetical protein